MSPPSPPDKPTGGTPEDIKPDEPKKRCGECDKLEGRDVPKVLKCTGCNAIVYCGKECQKKDWKHHKPICSRSNKVPHEAISAAIQFPRMKEVIARFGVSQRSLLSEIGHRVLHQSHATTGTDGGAQFVILLAKHNVEAHNIASRFTVYDGFVKSKEEGLEYLDDFFRLPPCLNDFPDLKKTFTPFVTEEPSTAGKALNNRAIVESCIAGAERDKLVIKFVYTVCPELQCIGHPHWVRCPSTFKGTPDTDGKSWLEIAKEYTQEGKCFGENDALPYRLSIIGGSRLQAT